MKIALLNDTHFGARNDSNIFDEYFYKFYDNVFFPYLKENNIKTLIHLGDIVDRRKYINYRIVKLLDGSTLVGSISLDKEFLRIQNPLQLITTPRMTEHGLKDDNTLAPWVPFTNDKMFVIPKDKVMVVSRAAKELANYYDVILTKLQQVKTKASYSPQEITKIMEIAEQLDEELRQREEEENLLYDETITKTIH